MSSALFDLTGILEGWMFPFSFTGVTGNHGMAYTNSRKLV